MLRIYLPTTHTCAVLMAIHAEKTKNSDTKDVLMIDYPPLKKSLIQLIKCTNVIHPWEKIVDFSKPINDEINKKPSLRKRVTRKLKQLPIIKVIYQKLLDRYTFRQKKQFKQNIELSLKDFKSDKVILNLLTKTALNEALFELYPEAEINYFEHGIGDYMYYAQNQIKFGSFYSVFSNEFKYFLKGQNSKSNENIFEYINGEDFESALKKLDEKNIISAPAELLKINKPIVFLLLENVEMYEVDNCFWTDYIDVCISKIENPSNYLFVIKPHHNQSFDAIQRTIDYIEFKKLDFYLLTKNNYMHVGAEILFYFIKSNTRFVFSLFSSSIYYLSKLFPSKEIDFYHGYDLFKKYTNNSPKQFTEIYEGIGPIITNVLSGECKKL
jgi:hypothetical protein